MTRDADKTADLMVIFGITGDLARKMTFRSLYRLERRGLLDCPIVGVASDDMTTEQLVQRAYDSITETDEGLDQKIFDRFAARLSYIGGDVTKDELYVELAKTVEKYHRPLYYLEMPPSLFGPIVEQLGKADLLKQASVAVEKPFGHDLDSARDLDKRLHRVLREDQLLRVDHFLGKEPVIELEYLRFANVAFAELWDRKTVSCIQITMAEDFDVSDRGKFYDSVGALRDVVQNHLLQVLALVTMDPPAGAGADELRDKKTDVFKAIHAADPDHYVRGQYAGYTDVPGVATDSTTETFVALRLDIDNWRWTGVPIFVRAGKSLAARATEVRLFLRRTPKLAFLPDLTRAEPNQIVLRIDPDPGLRLAVTARDEGSWRPVNLETSFSASLGEPPTPYERLFQGALTGDHSLFAREDAVEETWRIMQPLLDNPPPVHSYETGSWGPTEADTLLRGHQGWHKPWLEKAP